MLQMFGSLMIAANINQFFEQGLTWIGVTGYAIMRLASCSQWWRVYQQVEGHKFRCTVSSAWLTLLNMLGNTGTYGGGDAILSISKVSVSLLIFILQIRDCSRSPLTSYYKRPSPKQID